MIEKPTFSIAIDTLKFLKESTLKNEISKFKNSRLLYKRNDYSMQSIYHVRDLSIKNTLVCSMVTSVLYLNDRFLAIGNYKGEVQLVNLNSVEIVCINGMEHNSSISKLVKFQSKQNDTFASFANDANKIVIWIYKEHPLLIRMKVLHFKYINILDLLVVNENKILICSNQISVWSLLTNSVEYSLESDTQLAFPIILMKLGKSECVACSALDRTLRIHDINENKELFILKGSKSVINKIVNFNCNYVATSSVKDKVVKIWKIDIYQKESYLVKDIQIDSEFYAFHINCMVTMIFEKMDVILVATNDGIYLINTDCFVKTKLAVNDLTFVSNIAIRNNALYEMITTENKGILNLESSKIHFWAFN